MVRRASAGTDGLRLVTMKERCCGMSSLAREVAATGRCGLRMRWPLGPLRWGRAKMRCIWYFRVVGRCIRCVVWVCAGAMTGGGMGE